MNVRLGLAAVLAAVHLGLVVCGAANWFPQSGRGPAAKSLRWYGAMSGANSGYGFFAPEVGAQARAVFTLRDQTSRVWSDTLEAGENNEVQLRVSGMVSDVPTGRQRRALAASWAGKMFARWPEAEEITVRIEFFDLPTMDEYRDGEKPEWATEYEVTFYREGSSSEQER
jgi:hypothetical protein